MRVIFFLLPAAVMMSTTGCAQAAGQAPALARYRAEVHAVRLELDVLPRPAPSARVAAIANRLRSLGRVALPDGRVLTTDLPQLGSSLASGNTSNLSDATRSLDSLDDALGHARTAPASPAVLGGLDAVLRDSRFHPSENPIQRLLDWVGNQINRLLDAINQFLQGLVPGAPSASLPSFGFAALFLIVIAAAAIALARAVLRRAVLAAPAVDAENEPRTSLAAEERVDRHIADGDYRLALRYLLLGTLLRLQDLGALRLRPGLTNREYVLDLERELSRRSELARPMSELIEVFDRTWYGHRPITPEEYERCRALAAEALQALARGRVA